MDNTPRLPEPPTVLCECIESSVCGVKVGKVRNHKRRPRNSAWLSIGRGSALVEVPAIALLGGLRISWLSPALGVTGKGGWDLGAVLLLRGALAAGFRLALAL